MLFATRQYCVRVVADDKSYCTTSHFAIAEQDRETALCVLSLVYHQVMSAALLKYPSTNFITMIELENTSFMAQSE